MEVVRKKKCKTKEEIDKLREESLKVNKQFVEFYKDNLCLNKEDFNDFIISNQTDLPIVFRINTMNHFYEFVKDSIETKIKAVIKNNNKKDIRYIKLNNTIVYQIDRLDKNIKEEQDLKDFLTNENDLGILRQELVSQIPLNLININHSDLVLDACAAPGSKTLQAIEIMFDNANKKNILPQGVIWANDADEKRSKMLIHLIQNHPTLNLVVTRSDSRIIPVSIEDIKANNYLHNSLKGFKVQPDVVICDVPCSGDGTLRKSKNIKKNWCVSYSYQKHNLQKEILQNCINVCKVNGYIVYSTCAINPIENEAVICSVLEKYKDIVEIVDVSNRLSDLKIKYRKGLTKWKVFVDSNTQLYACSLEEYKYLINNHKNNDIKLNKRNEIHDSMFHSIYTDFNLKQSVLYKDPLNLNKCIRLYSHDNNSGSFFIAVLKKKKQIDITNKIYNIHEKFPLSNNDINTLDPIENGKTIQNDLIDFCDEYSIKDKELEKIKEAKEIELKNKQIEFNNLNTQNNFKLIKNFDETNEDTFDYNLFSRFISIEEILLNNNSNNDNNKYISPIDINKELNLFDIYFGSKKLKKEIYKNLFVLKDSYKKIYLLSEKLKYVLNFLTEKNFKIMIAGSVVFVDNRTKTKQSNVCRYRINYHGSLLLQEYINSERILDINIISNINNKTILDFLVKLTKYIEINYKDLDNEIKEHIFSKVSNYNSMILKADQFSLPIRLGKNYVRLMVPDNVLSVLKYYIDNYV